MNNRPLNFLRSHRFIGLWGKSRRYLEELVLGSGSSDIVIESTLDRDSLVALIAACQGADFSLTPSNVFEIA
jgi:hypothetical protein